MVEPKTFKNLQKEIIEPNICSLCGGCVSVCALTNTNAIQIMNEKPQFIGTDEDSCLDCGLCYQICPRTHALSSKLDKIFGIENGIGPYKKLVWAQTKDPDIMKICQDGGVVTSLIKFLLDTKMVDGAIVNMALSNWKSSPVLVTSSNQLLKTAGTRYSITSLLDFFQNPKLYSSQKEIEDVGLEAILSLLELNKFDYAKLAFVGCPCHVRAIRNMQIMKVRPATTIKFVIGLFCMENFTYDDLMKKEIEGKRKIKLNDIQKINIKKDFIITLKNNSVVEIPFKDIESSTRPNCLFCPDFSNIYADISIGGIGAPQNYSTVMVRNKVGERIYEQAISTNYLAEYQNSGADISKLRLRTLKLIQRMTKIKKERAEANLQKLIKPSKG